MAHKIPRGGPIIHVEDLLLAWPLSSAALECRHSDVSRDESWMGEIPADTSEKARSREHAHNPGRFSVAAWIVSTRE